MKPLKWMLGLAISLIFFLRFPALAQSVDFSNLIPTHGMATGRIIQLIVLITVLSVAPGLLMMVTSFTRFVIALSFLRASLGLQTTPGNLVLISLSLFLTFYVMGPTLDQAWTSGIRPLIEGKVSEEEALGKTTEPFRTFMLSQVRKKDLNLFEDLAPASFKGKDQTNVDFRLLIPAFMISELRRGFEIGFLVALPFLVIDLIVSVMTMSMGMMMMPPSVLSLPIKVLFFVLIDGWNLLVGSLVRSVH